MSSCKTYASIILPIQVSLTVFTAVMILFHITAIVRSLIQQFSTLNSLTLFGRCSCCRPSRIVSGTLNVNPISYHLCSMPANRSKRSYTSGSE